MRAVPSPVRVLVVAITVLLTACAGGDVVELSVADDSITRDEFAHYSGALNRLEISETAAADPMRRAAQQWVTASAAVQALESVGIVAGESDELEAEQFLQQAIANGTVGQVAPSTPGYDDLVSLAWLVGRPDLQQRLEEPDARERFDALRRDDVVVASRLGVWNREFFQILPPSASGG